MDTKTFRFDKNNINRFKEAILSVFHKYFPIKKKYTRINEAPLTTKGTHKEIMKRSKLKNLNNILKNVLEYHFSFFSKKIPKVIFLKAKSEPSAHILQT